MARNPRVYKLDLRPGDRVRYIKDGFLSNDPDCGVSLSATQGSLATVVSDEKYRTFYKQNTGELENLDLYNQNEVSSTGRVGVWTLYPICLEQILPVNRPWKCVIHKQGDIYLETPDSLEKLLPLSLELTLVLEHVRLILPEDDSCFRSRPDLRLLVIEFHIENPTGQKVDDKVRAAAWLTPVDQAGKTLPIFAVPVIQGAALIKGQVIFEFPSEHQHFRFKMELSGMGSVETDLYLQNFTPGDSVRLKGTTYGAWYDYFLASRPYDGYPLVDPFFIPTYKSIPAGSTGVILPFDRFRAAYIRHLERLGPGLVAENLAAIDKACARVKRDMEEGIAYPIDLTHLAPIPDGPAFDDWARKQFCKRAGEVMVVNALAIKKDVFEQKPLLSVHWVRIVLPGDDHPLRPEPGNKRILVDFSFENTTLNEPANSELVELWLSTHTETGAEFLLKPVSVEFYPPGADDLNISGQLAVDLPAGASIFELHLKDAAEAEWTQSFALPAYLPGDRIRMTKRIFGDAGSKPSHLAGDRGRIISYAEFLAELTHLGKKLDEDQRIYVQRWLALEKPDHGGDFEDDLDYPVIFEEVGPSEANPPAEQQSAIRWIYGSYVQKVI